MSHADFRPKKRSGVVPSGKPRRKIPLLRILLLIGVAFFVYLKFDSIWTGVRGTLNPAKLWSRTFGPPAPAPDTVSPVVWSADSSGFSLNCPRGLRTCCEGAPEGGAGLCRQAEALLAKARTRRLLGAGNPEDPARLFARAAAARTGREVFGLVALQGRSGARGAARGESYSLRQNASGVWCDSRPACLSEPSPQAPLLFGRLGEFAGGEGPRWTSGSASVHPVLPGRITAIDSVEGGVRVRVYHGGELYTSYEPLHLLAGGGIAPGVAVHARTVLGNAPWLSGGYTVLLRVRRAGLNLDPADYFRLQPLAVADAGDSTAVTDESP